MTKTKVGTIYQIKSVLRGSKPSIWRRFQVEDDITLGKLHRVIQTVMGWWGGHLHQFRGGDVYYADLHNGEDLECFEGAIDENKVKLNAALKGKKQKIVYEYDFGDGWEHDLILEKILSAEAGIRYPVCLAGKRACPPEDSGGIWGYEEILIALKDPKHPEHEEFIEWVPDGFDPEEFDLDDINVALRHESSTAKPLPAGRQGGVGTF